MKVFSPSSQAVPLRAIVEALQAAGHSVSVCIGLAGDATPQELEQTSWDAAFVRWHTPELHDVYLIERSLTDTEEEAKEAVAAALRFAYNWPDNAEKLITMDVLRRTRTVYDVEVLPAMAAYADHPGWEALATLVHVLAAPEGICYAEGIGFYDAEGEPLIVNEDSDEEE